MQDLGTITPGGPARWTPMGGYVGANHYLSTGRTFGGGAKEIQRNIIAQRGLGFAEVVYLAPPTRIPAPE